MRTQVKEFSNHATMKYCLSIITDLVNNGGKTTILLGLNDALAAKELAERFYIKTFIESRLGSYRYTVTLGE